jgi:hypothetical protein
LLLLKSIKFRVVLFFVFSYLFLFTGCSEKYIEKDFHSKKEYYSAINKTIKGEVTKLYSRKNGEKDIKDAYIDSTSIKWPSFSYDSSHFFIPLGQVKQINYENYQSFNPLKFRGSILLTNDSILHIYDAGILKDTINYYTIIKRPIIDSELTSKLISISCNDRNSGFWKFTLGGMFFGSMVGYELGSNASNRERDPQLGVYLGGCLAGIGGLIFGCLTGSPVEFSLDNGYQHYNESLIHHLGILGGVSKSLLYGNFSDNRGYSTDPRVAFSYGLYYEHKINDYIWLKPEVVYSTVGGNYNYNLSALEEEFFGEGQVSVIYLNIINIPLLVELRSSDSFQHYFKLLAGPCINVPLNCRLEEFQNLPMDEAIKTSSKELNIKQHISFEIGLGFNWTHNFSTDLYYDQVLSSFGTVRLHDGTNLDLHQFDYLLCAEVSF